MCPLSLEEETQTREIKSEIEREREQWWHYGCRATDQGLSKFTINCQKVERGNESFPHKYQKRPNCELWMNTSSLQNCGNNKSVLSYCNQLVVPCYSSLRKLIPMERCDVQGEPSTWGTVNFHRRNWPIEIVIHDLWRVLAYKNDLN
jgi:hypothetical protein